MALSGTFYGTTTNERVKPKIVWSAVQNVAGNYSDVTATLSYSRTNTGYETAGLWEGSITIDGDTKSESKNLSITYNSNTQAITHTVRVSHDSYGAKSLIISASGGIGISSMTATNISATVRLDTIARASSVSAVNGEIGSRVTVVVDRKNAAFTHSIAYAFGAESGYIKSDGTVTAQEQKMTATTVNFLIPTAFYAQIPGSKSGTCKLTCRTYSGNTLVGTATATFTATAGKAACAPAVTGKVEDVNEKTLALTGNSAVLIAGQSNAQCTVTATAKNGATVAQKQISGVAVTGSSRTIAGIEKGSVLFSATDSRGYKSQTTVTPTFIPYVKLTCNPSVRRPSPTGTTATLTLKGRCYKGSFGAKSNTLQIRYKVGSAAAQTVAVTVEDDNTYYTTVTLSELDYTQSYTVSVTAFDEIMTVTKSLQLQRGLPVFDWGKEDFQFHVPVYGDFAGTFGGVYIRQAFINGVNTLQIRTRYARFDAGYTSRQTIFLYGNASGRPVCGAAVVHGNGTVSWSGTENVSANALEDGKIQLTLPATAWDDLVFLSAKQFEIL